MTKVRILKTVTSHSDAGLAASGILLDENVERDFYTEDPTAAALLKMAPCDRLLDVDYTRSIDDSLIITAVR